MFPSSELVKPISDPASTGYLSNFKKFNLSNYGTAFLIYFQKNR